MSASTHLADFNPQELSNTLWALSQMQHTPSKPWMQQLLLASLQQMSSFVAADLTQTLCGLSKLGYSPSPLWFSIFWLKSGQSLAQSNFSAAELHALLLAAVKLEAQPPQKWVQVAAGAVERGLAGFGSQQLLEMLRALQQLAQAGDRSTAAVAPAAAANAAVVFVGSSSSSSGGVVSVGDSSRVPAAKWLSSCIVPISSSSGSSRGSFRGSCLQWQLQQSEEGTDLLSMANSASSNDSNSSSSSGGRVLKVKYPPGLVRLRRQVYHSRVTVAGTGLLRPVWPPINHHSLSAYASAAAATTTTSSNNSSRSSSSSGRIGGVLNHGREGIISAMAAQQQQQMQLQLWGSTGSTADEMYSLACLVQLMPQQRRVWVERWPQLFAAERAQERGVLRLQGLTHDRLVAAQ
jgi:hypothetical protein